MSAKARHRGPFRRRGFTLIEAMATVTILSVLGSIATFIVVDAVDDYQKAVTAAQLHAELAVALDQIGREVRQIPLDPDQGGDIPNITSFVDTQQLIWEGTGGETAHVLELAGRVYMRKIGGAQKTLLRDVSGFSLAAYDEDNTDLGASLSPPNTTPIRRVEFTITLTRDGISQTLRTKVFLRALMEGGG